jgi:DMSO/TMAO reductase YedYZ heme-binding membrane subunit
VANRWRNHVVLAALSLLAFFVARSGSPADSALDHLSIASAWLCVGFMAAALLFGPYLRATADRRVVNNYVRRDIGMWSALAGLVHFVVAIDVSMSPAYLSVYVQVLDTAISLEWRDRLFAWGSIVGTLAGVLLVILLAISNDKLLGRLGQKNWKRVQGLAYPAFLLTAVHGFAFQLLESRRAGVIILLAALCLLVIFSRLASRSKARRQ